MSDARDETGSPASPRQRATFKRTPRVRWGRRRAAKPLGAEPNGIDRKGTNGVSTNGVTANFMFLLTENFHYFCSGPISVDPICPQPNRSHPRRAKRSDRYRARHVCGRRRPLAAKELLAQRRCGTFVPAAPFFLARVRAPGRSSTSALGTSPTRPVGARRPSFSHDMAGAASFVSRDVQRFFPPGAFAVAAHGKAVGSRCAL